MAAKVKTRIRLMRQRLHIRWQRGIVYGVIGGTISMLMVWAGSHGKVEPWGNPIPFTEALPVFPFGGIIAFVMYVLWPWRHVNEDDYKGI